VFAWAVHKAKRVAGRVDAEVDHALDAGMDRLHDLVSRKLGEDPALMKPAEEAEAGQDKPSDRTRRRVQDALEEAAEQDPGFAEALDRAVKKLQALPRQAGGVSAGENGVAVGKDVNISAPHGVAGWHIDTVNIGNPPQPGTPQG
jgi:hypothetical protein